MLTWFIVAIVSFHEGDDQFQQMKKPFATKELCQQFYINNPSVRNDVLIMFPDQRGHTLVCLNQKQILELKGQTSI
jgi:hypothetical protein